MKQLIWLKMLFKYLTLISFAFILNSCGDGWFGDNEGPPLEGKRIAISNKDKELVGSASAKKISLNLPSPRSLGNWQYPGGLTTNAPGNLVLNQNINRIWSANAGSSTGKGKIATNPVIYNNVVYAMDSRSKVTAVNFQNGKVIWRSSLVPKGESDDEGFGGGLSADNGMVFATTGFGTLTALHAQTGKIIWQEKIGSPIRSAPLAVNGKVFIVDVSNMLTSFDQKSGEVNWDYRRYEEISGIISNTSPAYLNGILIVPFSNGEIVAIDTKDGTAKWGDTIVKSGGYSMMSRISEIAAKPVISDGVVYIVGNSGRMAAIDFKKGTRIWTKDIGGMITPSVTGNFVFVLDHSNRIIALSKKAGDVRWLTSLESLIAKGEATWTGPIMANNNLYAVSSTGILAKISADDGRILGTQNVSNDIYVIPILVNGTLVMLNDKGLLSAYR